MKKIIIAVICFSLVMVSLLMVKNKELPTYKKIDFRLGTICAVQIVGVDNYEGWAIAEKCFERIDELEMIFSIFEKESQLYQLNHAVPEQWMKIDDELYVVLAEALYYGQESDGYFDATILPLIQLWGFDKHEYLKPSVARVDRVRQYVGYQQIEIELRDNEYYARRLNSQVQVDLGGVAKGYICDELVDIIKEAGHKNFMVNIGGNIYAAGYGPRGKGWKVGVRDPRDETATIAHVFLNNEAISTSGDYERFFMHEGKRFSHIIDPKTGYPVFGKVAVTVVAETAMIADVASTTLFVVPEERRRKYFDRLRVRYAHIVEEHDGALSSVELGRRR